MPNLTGTQAVLCLVAAAVLIAAVFVTVWYQNRGYIAVAGFRARRRTLRREHRKHNPPTWEELQRRMRRREISNRTFFGSVGGAPVMREKLPLMIAKVSARIRQLLR
jgi:hypothetical protein